MNEQTPATRPATAPGGDRHQDDPPTDIWTVTKRHGEEMARVRGHDHAEAATAARQVIAVQRYEDAHGGFGLRRLRRSEAGPAADDEDV